MTITGLWSALRRVGAAIGTPALTALYATLGLHMHADAALHTVLWIFAMAFVVCVFIAWRVPKRTAELQSLLM